MNQRITVAVIVKDGLVLSYGTNEHREPCKRVGYPTGVGYELCKGCDYDNHAEANALYEATEFSCGHKYWKAEEEGCPKCPNRIDPRGGTLYLLGHTYACDPCKEKAAAKGVTIKIV